MASKSANSKLECPECGQAGVVTWKMYGSKRRPMGVSKAFHLETGRIASGESIIVCNICDEIQPD